MVLRSLIVLWALSANMAFGFPDRFVLNINKTIPAARVQEFIDQLNRRVDLSSGNFFEARVISYLPMEDLSPDLDYYGKVGLVLTDRGGDEAKADYLAWLERQVHLGFYRMWKDEFAGLMGEELDDCQGKFK